MSDKKILKFAFNSEVNGALEEVETDFKKDPAGVLKNKLIRHKKNIHEYTLEELSKKKQKIRIRMFCLLLTNLNALGVLMYISFIAELFTLREYLTILAVYLTTLLILYDDARSIENYNLYIYLKQLEGKIC